MKPIFTALMLMLAASASAQTPTFKLQWDQSEALATVQGFQYTLKVDTQAATTATATCVTQGTGTRCTTPLPTMGSGTHTLQLTAFGAGATVPADPLSVQAPSKASGMIITVTITIP